MERPVYPAASAFAARLADHFTRGAAASPDTPLPDAAAIESLVDAAFWASLQREEGYAPEISLAYLPPELALRPLILASPLALGPRALARLAPAVERPGIHLGVWRRDGALAVWGTTRAIPSLCFVLEVLGPGLLVVKHRIRDDSAKFRNVAVFEGELVKLLDRHAAELSGLHPVLASLLEPEWDEASGDRIDVLLRLAISMRAHRRGGTLLVVPAGTDAWRESVLAPVAYAVRPAFKELAELAGPQGRPPDGGALRGAVDAVAGLTAVDGATIITDRYELLAFGAKIGRPDGRLRVEQVVVTEPVEGVSANVVPSLQLGGTRHISAAQFAQDQQDAVALVASQDGRFTIFAWSPFAGMVQAHRVEALLL